MIFCQDIIYSQTLSNEFREDKISWHNSSWKCSQEKQIPEILHKKSLKDFGQPQYKNLKVNLRQECSLAMVNALLSKIAIIRIGDSGEQKPLSAWMSFETKEHIPEIGRVGNHACSNFFPHTLFIHLKDVHYIVFSVSNICYFECSFTI